MNRKKNESVRDRILATASRLFYKQGYANTGINQITAESGVVKSTLYQQFRSKEELLIAYLEQVGNQLNAELSCKIEPFEQPEERILSVFDFLKELMSGEEYYGCNFLNIISETPEDAVVIRAQILKQKNNIRELFQELLKPLGKTHLSDELYILFEGALIANKVHHELWAVDKAKNMVILLLKHT